MSDSPTEIADATLGGLACGVGMTTYSHKGCSKIPIICFLFESIFMQFYWISSLVPLVVLSLVWQVGLYQETVAEYEVVLGDGSLVTANREQNRWVGFTKHKQQMEIS